MRKIAVAMAKGGVGKTTTAVNLAHGLAMKGQRVLLADCDTQNQAAEFLGVNPEYGLCEFVTGQTENGDTVTKRDVIHLARENLWLVAGGIRLVELKNWLGEQDRDVGQTVLKSELMPREGTLDYMIFDCAPGWDILSVNILMAVNEIICPVELEAAAVKGLKTYMGYIQSAQKLNPGLRLRFVLPTMYDRRTRQSSEILEQLQNAFSDPICDPIRYNVRLSEAAGHGQTIFEYDKRATGADDYNNLIGRIEVQKNGNTEEQKYRTKESGEI